jgi:hypothetical protein
MHTDKERHEFDELPRISLGPWEFYGKRFRTNRRLSVTTEGINMIAISPTGNYFWQSPLSMEPYTRLSAKLQAWRYFFRQLRGEG